MKIKYPSFLVRVLVRFWKQSWKDYLMIVRQELRFSKLLWNCEPISIYDLYEILSQEGLAQIRYSGKKTMNSINEKNSSDISKWKERLQRNILIWKPVKTTIETQYGSFTKEVESPRFKVTIQNLFIYIKKGKDDPVRPLGAIGLDIHQDDQFKMTDIEFIDCIISERADETNILPDGFTPFKLEKFEDSQISFKNCIFRGILVDIMQRSGPPSDEEGLYVEFNNSFSISIHDGIWVYAFIDKRRYNVDIPDWFEMKDSSFRNISIDNCQFGEAWISGVILSLKGKNMLKRFHFDPPLFKYTRQGDTTERVKFSKLSDINEYRIHWGPYQTITPKDLNWEGHRMWLLELKTLAEKRGDYSQRDILNREILKCDRELIRREPGLASWQDRLTLWFNATFSNYGISWVRPLALLASVNFLYSLLVVSLSSNDLYSWEFLHTFLESFNPLYTPELSGEDKKGGMYTLLLGAGLLHKLFFAICVYEIIRAARRFSRQ